MLKRNIGAVSLFILLMSGAAYFTFHQPPIDHPLPQTIVVEEDEETGHLREAWIEELHKTAPGVDWRTMDERSRRRLYASGPKAKSSGKDTLAGGKLIGQWQEKGCRVQSGRIMVAEFDQSTEDIYCFSAGGIFWKGDYQGISWIPMNDQQAVRDPNFLRMVDHNGSTRFIAGTGYKYFYYSDDQGAHWDTSGGLSHVLSWGRLHKTAMANDSLQSLYLITLESDSVAGGSLVTLKRSTDHAENFYTIASWRELTYGSIHHFDIWAHRYMDLDPRIICRDSLFGINGDSLYFLGTVPATISGRNLLSGSYKTDSVFLYLYNNQKIYGSLDGGLNWSYRGDLNQNPFRNTSFDVSLDDPDILFFGAVNCYRSIDRGASWTAVSSWGQYYTSPAHRLHADIPNVQSFFKADSTAFTLVSTDAHIYRSENHLYTVTNLGMDGLNASRLYDSYTHRVDSNINYVGTQDQGYQRSLTDDGGVLTYAQEISGDYAHIVSGDSGNNIWMVYPGFTAFWLNAGTQNAQLKSLDFNGTEPFWLPPTMADPFYPYACYLAGGHTGNGGSRMLRIEYVGSGLSESALPKNFASNGGGKISAMAYSPIDPNHWYVLTDNGYFYHSSDAGLNWSRKLINNGPGAHYFHGATLFPSENILGKVYIGGSGYSNDAVWVTEDHGLSFTSIQNNLPHTMVYSLTGDLSDSLVFAATEIGPFAYVVSDDSWYHMGNGTAPDQVYWSVEYLAHMHTARFGTYGRGMWDFNLIGSSALSTNEKELAKGIKVYPNPASSHVRIELPKHSERILLLDMQGRTVLEEQGKGQLKFDLDLTGMEAGQYVVMTSSGSRIIVVNP
jgi:hypothetical protein